MSVINYLMQFSAPLLLVSIVEWMMTQSSISIFKLSKFNLSISSSIFLKYRRGYLYFLLSLNVFGSCSPETKAEEILCGHSHSYFFYTWFRKKCAKNIQDRVLWPQSIWQHRELLCHLTVKDYDWSHCHKT